MIDTRQGYALARYVDDRWCIVTAWRSKSITILYNAYLEPVQAWKRDLEEAGAAPGLAIVRIVDNCIEEIA